jgi:hypothetical protein
VSEPFSIVPPSNDACVGAIPVTVGTSIVGNLTFARSDENEVLNRNGCSGTLISVPQLGLWYKFVGTGGRVWPTTCFPASGNVDFSVYRGGCGATTLECIAGVLSPCNSFTFNRFTFNMDVGVTYYMLLRSSIDVDAFDLLISSVPAPASGNVNVNDLCTNAAPIAIGSTVAGNMSLATTDESEVPGDCLAGKPFGGRRGLWYTFDGTGAIVFVNTCSKDSFEVR